MSALKLSLVAVALFSAMPSFAEFPMVTDDAGTLEKDGKKIEGAFTKVSSERSLGLGFGISPISDVELGATYQRVRETSIPANANVFGVSAKWIPVKSGIMTAGLKAEYARADVSGGGSADSTNLWALATWRFESGFVVHANAGRSFVNSGGDINRLALGLEVPVMDKVQLTGDVFRSTGSDTGVQLGARFEVQKGLKLSAAFGRVDKENTAFAGFSWEF
jgi:hypothetical protein